MTSNQAVPGKAISTVVPRVSSQLRFAGDRVLLAGQIDYPVTVRPPGGFPLLFIVPHAGCNTRECYHEYADLALEAGYAVFRWDKRGTGRSGASALGSATQDAVYAYEMAVDQPDIDLHGVVILAQGAGTGTLGTSFGLFARALPPRGVILVANVLDPDAVLAIEAPIHIMMGEDDWNPWTVYAEEACAAHHRAYSFGATYYVARGADRNLVAIGDASGALHPGARKTLQTWLRNAVPSLRLT